MSCLDMRTRIAAINCIMSIEKDVIWMWKARDIIENSRKETNVPSDLEPC